MKLFRLGGPAADLFSISSTFYAASVSTGAFLYIWGMGQIIILEERCSGCPMIWDVILPDGSKGYIKYRWGIISLKKITERAGIFQDPIVSEQIGDDYDGTLSLDKAIEWLNTQGYKVACKVPA